MVKRYLLGVGVIIGIFAFNSTSAYADDVNMSVNLAASAALVLPSTPVNLAIQPTAEGRFSSDSFNVTAYSNSPAGYTLTMTTTSVDLTSDTYNAATETYPVISTLSDSVTASTFELNKWGISLDGGTTYVPMTAERTLADTTSTGALANGEVTTIGIGAKLDLETVPGKYSTTINFLLVAQPLPTDLEASYGAAGKSKVSIPGGGSYYSMQDMTSEICANSTESELQVVDTRDNKVYWILKAKDGKCWMTQNLDHDIVTTENYYTPDNTDIASNWTPVRATIQPTSIDPSTGNISGFVSDNYTPYSVNPGDWYWTDTWYPSNGCPGDTENNNVGCNYLAGGASIYFSTTAYAGNGEHGHVGNYYNWAAAVASNDTSGTYTDDTNFTTSICPKGWRLPMVGPTNEFENLLNAHNAYTQSGYEKDRAITSSPLYFVRGGQQWTTVKNAGYYGQYWASTINQYGSASYLNFSTRSVTPANSSSRQGGYSVRCVAR